MPLLRRMQAPQAIPHLSLRILWPHILGGISSPRPLVRLSKTDVAKLNAVNKGRISNDEKTSVYAFPQTLYHAHTEFIYSLVLAKRERQLLQFILEKTMG